MKQRPITSLENIAVNTALDHARAIRPDLEDAAVLALVAMVARETARNLTEALTNEGYIGAEKETVTTAPDFAKLLQAGNILKGKLRPEDVSTGVEAALDLIGSLLAKQGTNRSASK